MPGLNSMFTLVVGIAVCGQDPDVGVAADGSYTADSSVHTSRNRITPFAWYSLRRQVQGDAAGAAGGA
jgi:hypothetical protein